MSSEKHLDIVDLLSKEQRKDYLVNSFIKNIEYCINKIIPNDVIYLCKAFLIIDIKSNTELKLEQEWKQWYNNRKKSNHDMLSVKLFF